MSTLAPSMRPEECLPQPQQPNLSVLLKSDFAIFSTIYGPQNTRVFWSCFLAQKVLACGAMKKQLHFSLILTALALPLLGLAADEDPTPSYSGYYWGITEQNEECQVGLPKGLRGAITLQWTDSRGRTDGCIFMAKKISESPGVAKASGTNGRDHCKIRLNLRPDGSIESADLAFGGIFNFGYNAKCTDLKELNEF